MGDEQKALEESIASTQKNLAELERKLLFTSDPSERRQIEQRIEALQRDLFERRKSLAALSPARDVSERAKADPRRPLVFVSYSHEDMEWLDRLRAHLKRLERDGVLDIWDDRRIEAGSHWREDAEIALKTAKAVVLLISADYLASDFVADRELPFLIEMAHERGVQIFPIILSPCRFARTPLSRFQAINSPTSPLSSKTRQEQERILSNAAQIIWKAVEAGTTGLHPTRS